MLTSTMYTALTMARSYGSFHHPLASSFASMFNLARVGGASLAFGEILSKLCILRRPETPLQLLASLAVGLIRLSLGLALELSSLALGLALELCCLALGRTSNRCRLSLGLSNGLGNSFLDGTGDVLCSMR